VIEDSRGLVRHLSEAKQVAGFQEQPLISSEILPFTIDPLCVAEGLGAVPDRRTVTRTTYQFSKELAY
jgi:hypothetical protein